MDGLFSAVEVDAPAGAKPGWRLERLEVYNWGTFDAAVYTLDLGGDDALLTGDIGSGKSTLVDAVTTLLLRSDRINYNKAAGADSRERRQEWYSMLLAIGNQRGWKTGAAAHRYRERFGVWPRDLIEVAKAPDLEVRNWMKARQIAFLKGKAKSEAGAGAHAA